MSELHLYTGCSHRDPRATDKLPMVDPAALQAPEGYRVHYLHNDGCRGQPGPWHAAAGDRRTGLGQIQPSHQASPGMLGLGKVLRLPVKSDTESRDLFYRFDSGLYT